MVRPPIRSLINLVTLVDNRRDYAVTSSIRIAQVFPELVGKKTDATMKVYKGMYD